MDLVALLCLLLGLALGVVAGFLLAPVRGHSARALAEAQAGLLAVAEGRFQQAEARVSGDLAARQEAVDGLVAPLKHTLGRVEAQLHELEKARLSAYAALTEQLSSVRQTSEALRTETGALVTALRAPQSRGRWGEMQLRRVVEVAGMVEHCDFSEQPTAATADRALRPDLVVHLAGDKHVVVDSKVPLTDYLEAAELPATSAQQVRLRAHAKALRAHVDALAAKEYWAAFSSCPEFVVLFVPGEAFLAPALEQDPSLLEYAMEQRVVIATPTTLLTLLRTVAYSWQQSALTENARQVFEVGQELYKRLGTLGGHMDKLGRSLRRSVDDYNSAVGSLERNVLVQARKLATLKVTDRRLDEPHALDATPRPLTAPELVEDAQVARDFRLVRGPESFGRGRADDGDAVADPALGDDDGEAAAMP